MDRRGIRKIIATAALGLFLAGFRLGVTWAADVPPLVAAAQDGKLDDVQRLLANGADPNSHDEKNLTALNWAAYNGHLAIVQALVERGAEVDSSGNPQGWTPLMNAAAMGRTSIVTYLIGRGADVRRPSKGGYMPLGYAVVNGHEDTARALRNRIEGAIQYGPAELVLFVNNSSGAVTVSVDGSKACSLQPGTRCSAFLSKGDSDFKHGVHAEIAGKTWDDRVAISECHWNWNGVKSYTFTNAKVPFECRK